MKAAGKLLHENELLHFLVSAPPAISSRKERHRERLQRCVTQPVVWLLTRCCPSKAEGTAAAAWWQSRHLPVKWERPPLASGSVQNRALLSHHTQAHGDRVGISRSHRIPGPSGSLRLCLYPHASTGVSTAPHHPCTLPPPSVPITAPQPLREGLWVPGCAHTAEVLRKVPSGCVFYPPLSQWGYHRGATPTKWHVCSLLFHFLPGRRRRVSFKHNAASSMPLSRACLIAAAAGAPGFVPAQLS